MRQGLGPRLGKLEIVWQASQPQPPLLHFFPTEGHYESAVAAMEVHGERWPKGTKVYIGIDEDCI